GIGSLPRLKLGPQIERKVFLEAHTYTSREAKADGIVDIVADPSGMMLETIKLAETWKTKAKVGAYGMLHDEMHVETMRKM
ncbi:uncharacterized protein A1O9_02294, partial [Exophiala aquamarina CBS 119918]